MAAPIHFAMKDSLSFLTRQLRSLAAARLQAQPAERKTGPLVAGLFDLKR